MAANADLLDGYQPAIVMNSNAFWIGITHRRLRTEIVIGLERDVRQGIAVHAKTSDPEVG